MTFVSVWEYEVRPGAAERFEALYGSAGAWVELFGRAEGYLGTELLRSDSEEGRYVTLDRWASRGHHDRFRAGSRAEYDRLDREGDRFTLRERHLGSFEALG